LFVMQLGGWDVLPARLLLCGVSIGAPRLWDTLVIVKQVGFGAQGRNQRLETRNQKLDLNSDF
jgi:hypothetical protein